MSGPNRAWRRTDTYARGYDDGLNGRRSPDAVHSAAYSAGYGDGQRDAAAIDDTEEHEQK